MQNDDEEKKKGKKKERGSKIIRARAREGNVWVEQPSQKKSCAQNDGFVVFNKSVLPRDF